MRKPQFNLTLAGLIAILAFGLWLREESGGRNAAAETPQAEPTATELKSEIERLKTLLPDQAHAMQDVGYHFTNLWFAAQQNNWPLADFYLGETRSHLQWAVRLKPLRKDTQKRDIDLVAILQAVENTPLKALQTAVADKDHGAFDKAYRSMLQDGCYTCHKASDKPYLRPQVPTASEVQVINFDPQADWPK